MFLLMLAAPLKAEWGGIGGLSTWTSPEPVVATGDTDGDGIPDSWEDAHGLDKTNPDDASSDFDLDGVPALEEYYLHNSTGGTYGNPVGNWSLSTLPPPPLYSYTTLSLIETASNGTILARIVGRTVSGTPATAFPYTYSPSTGLWTRVLLPPGYSSVISVTGLDVNSSGQVVGYFVASGVVRGFVWTPSVSGGSSTLFNLSTGGTTVPAIPTRISDTGYVIGNKSSLSGTSFAGTVSGQEVTFPGMWTAPIYHDVNDYGEFVGTVVDPFVTHPSERNVSVFLAAEGFPVTMIRSGADDGSDVRDLEGLWGHIPDINPLSITWNGTGTDGYQFGTAVDSFTNASVHIKEGPYAALYWGYDVGGPDEEYYAYMGFTPVLGGVNDWGEYVGSLTAAMLLHSSGGLMGEEGQFFYDGDYRFTDYPAVYSVNNDPKVLVGTPYAIWAGDVTVPVADLIPGGASGPIFAARMADNSTIALQHVSNTIHVLAPDQDSDGDGMPDDWEIWHGLNPAINDAGGDPDGDGYLNIVEYLIRTDPNDPNDPSGPHEGTESPGLDSDGDGIPDSWERAHGFDPNNANDGNEDFDGDGLTNLQEFLAGTDPRLVDTDGDGISDSEDADPLSRSYDETAISGSLRILTPSRP